MKKPMRRRTSSSKKDYYMITAWITLIITLIFRIPLVHMIGDNGMAYFAAANELCLLTAGSFAYGLSEAVSSLVRYRVKRDQHKSAGKVLGISLILGAALGLILTVAIGLGGQLLVSNVMHLPLAAMAVEWIAPAAFFFMIACAFKGYFQGKGIRMAAVHARILYTLSMIIGALTGAGLWHKYGEKVSALLQNTDYAGAYGARGASIGLPVAAVLCCLHALILYVILKRSASKQPGRESQVSQDTVGHILGMLSGTAVLHMLFWFCFHSLPLIDQLLFLSHGNENGNLTLQWGTYYGKCLVILGVIGGAINLICLLPVRHITAPVERSENRYADRYAGDRLGALIHQCAVFTIPAAVFTAIFAENILDFLYTGNNQKAASWLLPAVLIIIFQVFSSVFMEILFKIRRFQYELITGGGALLLHIFLTLLLLRTAKAGIYGVIVSATVFYALVTVAGFFFVSRLFQYKQEWIRSFVITIAAAAVSGLVSLLLNRLLASLIGTAFSMLVGLIPGIGIYVLLLIMTRAFRRDELEMITGGRLFERLAQLLHY